MVRTMNWNGDRLCIEIVKAKKGIEAGRRSTDCDRTAGDGTDVHVIG